MDSSLFTLRSSLKSQWILHSSFFTQKPMDSLLFTLRSSLIKNKCSLVLQDKQGNIRLFYKKGVRDLEDMLNNEPDTLKGAVIADKVIGKAAAGMMAYGGVTEVYAGVLSRKAIPLLKDNNIKFSYGELVDAIVIPQGDTRCPLEQIVSEAQTASEVVRLLRNHFRAMSAARRGHEVQGDFT